MERRRIGSTDLVVSAIGFGAGGNAGLMLRGTMREQDAAVAHAFASGITYFDTAPDYGDGLAERNLGRGLRAAGAGQAVLTTKVEIRAENLGDIAGHIERSLEASLTRLERDHIDVLQIHNGPVSAPPALQGRNYKTLALADFFRADGVLDGLDRVIRAGKARTAGFVSRGHDRTEATALLETGRFKLINLPYSLLNPTAGRRGLTPPPGQPDYDGLIEAAATFGCGVAGYSPLAGGLLTPELLNGGSMHPLARPKDEGALRADGLWQQAQDMAAAAAAFDIDLVALAYRFILQHSGISTIVGGFSSREQIDRALNLPDDPLPSELLARLDAIQQGC